jgi:hypothetical protein
MVTEISAMLTLETAERMTRRAVRVWLKIAGKKQKSIIIIDGGLFQFTRCIHIISCHRHADLLNSSDRELTRNGDGLRMGKVENRDGEWGVCAHASMNHASTPDQVV